MTTNTLIFELKGVGWDISKMRISHKDEKNKKNYTKKNYTKKTITNNKKRKSKKF